MNHRAFNRAFASTASVPKRVPSSLIRILVADSQILFRQSLRALLQAEADFTIVGETGDGVEAIRMAEAFVPDIVLLDSALSRLHGFEVVSTLRRQRPTVRAILLTSAMARSAQIDVLSRGARGLVLKGGSSELLCRSIRCVAAGQTWISRDVVSDLIDELADQQVKQSGPARSAHVALTPREWEILSHVVTALPTKEIAKLCACREDTVKHHLTKMFAKTGSSNRMQLAMFALNQRVDDAGRTLAARLARTG